MPRGLPDVTHLEQVQLISQSEYENMLYDQLESAERKVQEQFNRFKSKLERSIGN